MKTFKLLRVKGGKLYPLFVERCRELPMGEWLEAGMGELVDENHVKSSLGPLARRPGWHSCTVPFTDWIGKRQGVGLVQRKATVWCECEVDGEEVIVTNRNGLGAFLTVTTSSVLNRISLSPGSFQTGSG